MKLIIIFLLLINQVEASFKTLHDKTKDEKPSRTKLVKDQVKQVKKKNSAPKIVKEEPETLESLRAIQENSIKMDELLRLKTNLPYIIDQSFQFQTGDVLRGTLLNSVVSTNLESPLLIRVDEGQGLPEGTKLSCVGVTKHRRVITACNLIITENNEYPVESIVLNTDGTAGLKGVYYDHQEEYVAGAIASQFAQGILEVSQSRRTTVLGSELENTAKNKLLQGLINSSNTITNTLEEEMKSKEPKVFIDAGKKVLVYFTQSFRSQQR